MTAPIVERVARAICDANGIDPDKAFDPDVEGAPMYWTIFIPEARASIAVQQELIQQLRDALSEGEGALTSAVLALAHASQESGGLYQKTYEEVDRTLRVLRGPKGIAAADAALKDNP
jgi:hypothetical protein